MLLVLNLPLGYLHTFALVSLKASIPRGTCVSRTAAQCSYRSDHAEREPRATLSLLLGLISYSSTRGAYLESRAGLAKCFNKHSVPGESDQEKGSQ